jgi:hypothetical protein
LPRPRSSAIRFRSWTVRFSVCIEGRSDRSKGTVTTRKGFTSVGKNRRHEVRRRKARQTTKVMRGCEMQLG